MSYKTLFLFANEPMTIWREQNGKFSFLEANPVAKKQPFSQRNTPLTLAEWFAKEEVLVIHSLCKHVLQEQKQACEIFYYPTFQKHMQCIPLSQREVILIEKRETNSFPFFVSSTEVMLNLDAHDFITVHSHSYETMTGFSQEDINRKSLFEFVHEDDRHSIRQALQNVRKSKLPSMTEWRLRNIKNRFLPIEMSFSPILDEEGDIQSILLIGRDISERKEQEEKLYHFAFHDPLTELPNRRFFTNELTDTLRNFERNPTPFALLLLDCDDFKQINDIYGHDIGDEVIKGFAQRVESLIRKSDTLSRFGGDEFSLLLPEVLSKEDVAHVAKRIMEKIEEPWIFNDLHIQTTVSIGICYIDEKTPHVTINKLLKQADLALYEAKRNGKNHFQFYNIHRTANE